MLTPPTVDRLAELGVMITVTFGGTSQATHDRTRPAARGGFSSYERIRKNLPYLFQVYGPDGVWANNTLTRDEIDYWRVFEHAVDLGFKRIKMNHVQSDPASAFSWDMLPDVAARRHEFYGRYLDYLASGGDAVLWHAQRVRTLRLREPNHVPGPCGTNQSAAINTDGYIYNCQRFNAEGWVTATQRNGFTERLVRMILHRYGSVPRGPKRPPSENPNDWWLGDLADELDMPLMTLYGWMRRGWIKAHRVRGQWAVTVSSQERRRLERLRGRHPSPIRKARRKSRKHS